MQPDQIQVPQTPQIPQIPQAPMSASVGRKHYHVLGPIIVFLICMGLFFLIYSVSSYSAMGLSMSKTFIIGAFIISAVITGIFSLIALGIRKIGARFGHKWAIISWTILYAVPLLALGGVFLNQIAPSPGFKIFEETSSYSAPAQDWKTYINEEFDLSLKYPPELTVEEGPYSIGFDDVFSLRFKKVDETGDFNLIIFATTDASKCTDLLANAAHMLPADLKRQKDINGDIFLQGQVVLSSVYGTIENFVYMQKEPVCKVAIVPFADKSIPDGAPVKNDYASVFKLVESILGSMGMI